MKIKRREKNAKSKGANAGNMSLSVALAAPLALMIGLIFADMSAYVGAQAALEQAGRRVTRCAVATDHPDCYQYAAEVPNLPKDVTLVKTSADKFLRVDRYDYDASLIREDWQADYAAPLTHTVTPQMGIQRYEAIRRNFSPTVSQYVKKTGEYIGCAAQQRTVLSTPLEQFPTFNGDIEKESRFAPSDAGVAGGWTPYVCPNDDDSEGDCKERTKVGTKLKHLGQITIPINKNLKPTDNITFSSDNVEVPTIVPLPVTPGSSVLCKMGSGAKAKECEWSASNSKGDAGWASSGVYDPRKKAFLIIRAVAVLSKTRPGKKALDANQGTGNPQIEFGIKLHAKKSNGQTEDRVLCGAQDTVVWSNHFSRLWARGSAGSRGAAAGVRTSSCPNSYSWLEVWRGQNFSISGNVEYHSFPSGALDSALNPSFIATLKVKSIKLDLWIEDFTATTETINEACHSCGVRCNNASPTLADCGFASNYSWLAPDKALSFLPQVNRSATSALEWRNGLALAYDRGTESSTPTCSPEACTEVATSVVAKPPCLEEMLVCSEQMTPTKEARCNNLTLPADRRYCGTWQKEPGDKLESVYAKPAGCGWISPKAEDIYSCPQTAFLPAKNYGDYKTCTGFNELVKTWATKDSAVLKGLGPESAQANKRWLDPIEQGPLGYNPSYPQESWLLDWSKPISSSTAECGAVERQFCKRSYLKNSNKVIYQHEDQSWTPYKLPELKSVFDLRGPDGNFVPEMLLSSGRVGFALKSRTAEPLKDWYHLASNANLPVHNALLPEEANGDCPADYPRKGGLKELLCYESVRAKKACDEKLVLDISQKYLDFADYSKQDFANLKPIERCTKKAELADPNSVQLERTNLGRFIDVPESCKRDANSYCEVKLAAPDQVSDIAVQQQLNSQRASQLGYAELSKFDPQLFADKENPRIGCKEASCAEIAVDLNSGEKPGEVAKVALSYNLPLHFPLSTIIGESLPLRYEHSEATEAIMVGRETN